MKKLQLLGVLCACFGLLLSFLAHATAVPGQGSWETTLLPRDLDGNPSTIEAYYDTVLNITWLADANAAGSSTMTWYSAIAWAAGLNINGITGWRLPVVHPIDGTTADDMDLSYIGTEDRGYNVSAPGTLYAGSTASEMAYMFYNTLGNLAWCDPGTSTVSSCSGPQAGWGLTNTGPFSNLQSNPYWSNTTCYSNLRAWDFHFDAGNQGCSSKTYPGPIYAWAVHDGDVGAGLPIPPGDTDGDGLPNNIEDKNGNGIVDPGETDPLNPDTDGDGALDGQEDANHNGVVDAGEADPLDFDSDDDGLTDGYEINVIGTDPSTSTTVYKLQCDMNFDNNVNLGDLILLQRQLLDN